MENSAIQKTAKKGALINTIFLYSEQCPVLLQQALELEKTTKDTDGPTPNQQQPYQEESSDDDESDVGGSTSSSSSSEGEEDEREPPQEPTELPEKLSKETNKTLPNNASQRKKKKANKATMTQQQQQQAVKKHVENLVCDVVPINDTEALHISTSLLSKHHAASIAERNYVAPSPCQDYYHLSQKLQTQSVLVMLLRSGRFAAGIFQGAKCLHHRACQRYTVRKGQGKAQSTQDGSRRPKSMGAQLRRHGEEQLQQDIRDTMQQWKQYLVAPTNNNGNNNNQIGLILVSCPKSLKKYLMDATGDVLPKEDSRWRRLPLDIGRPTFENVCIAHQVLMSVSIRQLVTATGFGGEEEPQSTAISETKQQPNTATNQDKSKEEESEIVFPLTPLHDACQKGDLEEVKAWLSDPQQSIPLSLEENEDQSKPVAEVLHRRVGSAFMTCLHYAAASSEETAATCVSALLLEGKADPCLVDSRNRPPYFLAQQDNVRNAFRIARATLGEDYCLWDQLAKVGPPLTQEDIDAKREKEAEKKRKKRARQKQKKAADKAAQEKEEQQRQQVEQARLQQEEAKRVRDGLQPRAAAPQGGTVCDFCQTVVKGRKRKDMFSRLEYVYCSADCVQKHKRELMAAAAMSRFGS